jgi:proteasome-associated ATPase
MPTPREEREALQAHINKEYVELQETLAAITAATHYFAVVVDTDTRTVYPGPGEPPVSKPTVLIVNQNGVVFETLAPPKGRFAVKPGDVVKIVTRGNEAGIVEKFNGPVPGVKMVVKTADEKFAYVTDDNHPAVYLAGSKAKAGDTILVAFGRVAVEVIEEKTMEYSFKGDVTVTYEDIAGLSEAKAQVREALEDPIQYREMFEQYGRKAPKGIVFFGPPGNGKTMLAKAAANSIGKLYDGEAGFISIKGPELLSSYVGATESRIRKLFAEARAFKKRTGNPAIIFIDEAEAILPRRGSGRSSDVEKTIVPMFLSEMDGLDNDSGAIVMLATNKPELLDEAVLREGRIDRKIKIGRPDKEVAKAIFELNFRKSKLADKLTPAALAAQASEDLFSEGLRMYEAKAGGACVHINYGQLISGAAVASIAQDAIGLAMKRDIVSKAKKPTGVTQADITKAIMNSFAQNKQIDHRQIIFEEMEEMGVQLTECNKVN